MSTNIGPTLVVMAAGIGARYGGLKQLAPVGPRGEILLEYAVYDALRAGFGRVVFVLRPDIEEAFRALAAERFGRRIPVEIVLQEMGARGKPWGTGHAVLAAASAVREPFAVINADDFYGRSSLERLAEFLRSLQAGSREYALVGFRVERTLSSEGGVARAVCEIDPVGRLIRIVERTAIEAHGEAAAWREGSTLHPLPAGTLVSMNLWGFTPEVFPALKAEFAEFLPRAAGDPKAELQLPAVIGALVSRREAMVRVLPTEEPWLGMTYPGDRSRAAEGLRARVSRGEYPEFLWR